VLGALVSLLWQYSGIFQVNSNDFADNDMALGVWPADSANCLMVN
jgi:hypothetical protein